MSDAPPDRLSLNPRSPFHDAAILERGIGIHWPQLDEDIAVDDLLFGRPSGESQESLRRWLAGRAV